MKEKWECCYPDWFLKHRKEKFENGVIASAQDGSNVFGMFYQNDIESLHLNEKKKCFQKKSAVEAARSSQGLMESQENDEVRAIYGAGNYMLATPYSKFQVESARWHLWSKERGEDHVQKFRNYCPTPSNFYPKPENAG